MNDETLRIPPQSIEAEQAVLGGLLLPNDRSFDIIADILCEDDFYRRDHALIFRAISELAEKDKPYDAITVAEWFEAKQLHEGIDPAYLIHLANNTASAANIVAYAHIVKDKAVLRHLIEEGTKIIEMGFRPDGRDTRDLLAEAESRVLAVAKVDQTHVLTGDEVLRMTVAELGERRKMGVNDLLGITTSLDQLDGLTHGLQATDLIVLAARPSMGKTALALQMHRAAAMEGRRPFLIELEMSDQQVMMRQIAAAGRIDFGKVQMTARAMPEEMEAIRRGITNLRGLQWWMDCSAGLNIDMIAAKLRRMKKQHDIGIAFIDYLQYIDLSRQLKNTNGNTAAAVQEITRRLKALAKELRIPIVLLSQLNRSLEQRRDKRPILSDLRESGAIEQDADVVMFIHREGYYEDWARDDARNHLAEVIVAKARNGIVDTARVRWDGKYQTFDNLGYDDPATYWNPARTSTKGGFEPEFRAMPRSGAVPVNQTDED